MKENKKSAKSSQEIYRLRVYKDFEYPSFSIDKNNRLEDASYKALEDVRENSENPDYFKCEITHVLPFTLKSNIEEIESSTDYDFFIREIALENTREKFGEINYETNPSIYEAISKTDTSVTLHLIPEVEEFYITQVRKYATLIKNKKIPY